MTKETTDSGKKFKTVIVQKSEEKKVLAPGGGYRYVTKPKSYRYEKKEGFEAEEVEKIKEQVKSGEAQLREGAIILSDVDKQGLSQEEREFIKEVREVIPTFDKESLRALQRAESKEQEKQIQQIEASLAQKRQKEYEALPKKVKSTISFIEGLKKLPTSFKKATAFQKEFIAKTKELKEQPTVEYLEWLKQMEAREKKALKESISSKYFQVGVKEYSSKEIKAQRAVSEEMYKSMELGTFKSLFDKEIILGKEKIKDPAEFYAKSFLIQKELGIAPEYNLSYKIKDLPKTSGKLSPDFYISKSASEKIAQMAKPTRERIIQNIAIKASDIYEDIVTPSTITLTKGEKSVKIPEMYASKIGTYEDFEKLSDVEKYQIQSLPEFQKSLRENLIVMGSAVVASYFLSPIVAPIVAKSSKLSWFFKPVIGKGSWVLSRADLIEAGIYGAWSGVGTYQAIASGQIKPEQAYQYWSETYRPDLFVSAEFGSMIGSELYSTSKMVPADRHARLLIQDVEMTDFKVGTKYQTTKEYALRTGKWEQEFELPTGKKATIGDEMSESLRSWEFSDKPPMDIQPEIVKRTRVISRVTGLPDETIVFKTEDYIPIEMMPTAKKVKPVMYGDIAEFSEFRKTPTKLGLVPAEYNLFEPGAYKTVGKGKMFEFKFNQDVSDVAGWLKHSSLIDVKAFAEYRYIPEYPYTVKTGDIFEPFDLSKISGKTLTIKGKKGVIYSFEPEYELKFEGEYGFFKGKTGTADIGPTPVSGYYIEETYIPLGWESPAKESLKIKGQRYSLPESKRTLYPDYRAPEAIEAGERFAKKLKELGIAYGQKVNPPDYDLLRVEPSAKNLPKLAEKSRIDVLILKDKWSGTTMLEQKEFISPKMMQEFAMIESKRPKLVPVPISKTQEYLSTPYEQLSLVSPAIMQGFNKKGAYGFLPFIGVDIGTKEMQKSQIDLKSKIRSFEIPKSRVFEDSIIMPKSKTKEIFRIMPQSKITIRSISQTIPKTVPITKPIEDIIPKEIEITKPIETEITIPTRPRPEPYKITIPPFYPKPKERELKRYRLPKTKKLLWKPKKRKRVITPLADWFSLTVTESALLMRGKHPRPTKKIKKRYVKTRRKDPLGIFPTAQQMLGLTKRKKRRRLL